MDSSINRSIENIFIHCLKRRASHCFADLIDKELEKANECPDFPSEILVENISRKILSLDQFSDLQAEFSRDLEHVLDGNDSELSMLFERPFFENQSADSLAGSLSSLNSSSIDFLSSEQLKNIVSSLGSVSVLRKIETLGTLNRLSTLEHVMKQTLWPEVEAHLCHLITSDIVLLQEGALAVFIKMLSSSEPQVVRQGLVSLVKAVPNVLPPDLDDSSQFQFAVRLLKAINKFQLYIPSYWLRYPHKVINDIICCSVSLWAKKPEFMWNVVPAFDLSGRWLKNFMHSSIGQSFIFPAFQKYAGLLMQVYSRCQRERLHEIKCCNDVNLKQQIYAICCLSYFLRYKNGRILLNSLSTSENGWKEILNEIMKQVWGLCDNICGRCFLPLYEAIPYMYSGSWTIVDAEVLFNSLCLNSAFSEQTMFNASSSFLLSKCLCQILICPPLAVVVTSFQTMEQSILILAFKHFAKITRYFDTQSIDYLEFYKSVFHLIRLVVSIPLRACYKHSTLFIDFLSSAGVQSNIEAECVLKYKLPYAVNYRELVTETCLEFLRTPIGIVACYEMQTVDSFLLLLLDKIGKSFQCHKLCVCDISLLVCAISYDFGLNFRLKPEHVTKLETVISSGHLNDDNLPSSDNTVFLNTFVTCIVGKISWPAIESADFSSACKLISHLGLRCDIPPEEVFICEENVVCALTTLSVLVYDFHIICTMQKLSVQELLFRIMSDFVREDGNVLICPITILLNFIIIKLYSVSGPGETFLPPKDLTELEDYAYPFVLIYPPHLAYFNIKPSESVDQSLTVDMLDIEDIQTVLMNHLENSEQKSENTVSKILAKSIDFIGDVELISKMPPPEQDVYFELNDEVMCGIDMTVKYSTYIGCTSEDIRDDVEQLLQQCISSSITDCNETFDVFIGCAYLALQCSLDTTWSYLKTFANCKTCIFVWKHRSLKLSKWNNWAVILECCDSIIMESLPTIYSAFKMCGVYPSLLFDYWIGQCFWNHLDWTEINCFLALVSVFGGEYALYYFVAILKHLGISILQCSYNHNIISTIKGSPIKGFTLSQHIGFIQDLAKKYSSDINKVLEQIF